MVELRLEACALRDWRPADATSLAHHADDIRIWRNVRDRFPHPYTAAHARHWISIAGTAQPTTDLAITVGDEAVGGIGLTLGEDISRVSAEVGYWLGAEHWGKGIATQAVRAFSAWAFERFDVQRLHAGVLEWNPASMRVLEKAGYLLEARARRAVIKDGQVMDDFVYAMVRDDLTVAAG